MLRRTLPAVAGLGMAMLTSTVAAEPGVLYVPDIDIELHPSGTGQCTGIGGQTNSGLGCTADVGGVEVIAAYPGAAALRASLAAALDAYDVHLADTRPPEYLAYTMLLPSEDPLAQSLSFTCSAGGINCGARKRNDIVWVFGPTGNCLVSDVVLTSIYAFGRASGLEGVADPIDAMFYVPDFGMGTGTFQNLCIPIVNQIGFDDMGQQVQLPLECTSLDHVVCPDDQQNSHADLLAYYGPRVVDLDPPVANNLVPEDGSVIAFGQDLVMDVDLSDADPVLGARWTVYSEAIEQAGIPDGVITQCTNDVCFVGWADASPLKATDSDWSLTLSGAPEGEYEITFEASDFHGNVMEPIFMVVTVGDVPPSTTTDGMGSEGDDTTTGPPGTTTSTTLSTTSGDDAATLDGPGPVSMGTLPGGNSSAGDDSSGAEQDGDGLVDHGCTCRSSPTGGGPGGLLLLTLVARRRRRAR